ncbi:type II secretion system protein GspD [Burkholderia sp. MSMB2157WGS]|uniref:type II secretion system protein GspD n=1 Tax=Burkholderia sp. MSMB2157WGS TaxID=1637928 RepID=UPI000758C323|nr:type II secretory pathway protein [Burkholderia sp. MSMB2157WGS]KWE56321.1 type II secretory pathway protein [Burkholderia sp. MSMB2157WGS]
MRILFSVLLFVAGASWGAESPVPASMPPLPSVVGLSGGVGPLPAPPLMPLKMGNAKSVDLRFVNVAQVIDLVYADMLQSQYVITPDVLADTRTVSFRFDRSKGDIRDVLGDFLASLGFGMVTKNGVDYVFKRKEDDKKEPDKQAFVYVPKYRTADYLARLVQPLFSGQFTMNRAVPAPPGARAKSDAPSTSAAAMVDQSSDTMVFLGSEKEIAMLKSVLPQVDTKTGEVAIRAWVYEVSTENDRTTGFQLAANLLGGRLGISLGAGTVDQNANALRLHTGVLDAAIAALDSDSRFHVVTSPNLRVESGKHGRLNVGQSVPVIDSVSYPNSSGAPVQSVAYQDAGIIFDVQPTVRGDVIDTDVTVEISDFQKTSTGVNNSPTKNTRKSETSMALRDGEVVVMGGLSQGKDSTLTSGIRWLPSFLDGRNVVRSRSDIVLVLQVSKI